MTSGHPELENEGLTPEQVIEADHYQDTEGLSPYDAQAKTQGYFNRQETETTDDAVTYRLPGKPLHFPPSGHVHDYSGRADEFRGGDMAIPRTDISREVASTTAKYLKRRRIQHDYLDGKLPYHEACVMYRDFLGEEASGLISSDLGDGSFYLSSIKRIE